jgi:DNA-binding NtrC family response regulator
MFGWTIADIIEAADQSADKGIHAMSLARDGAMDGVQRKKVLVVDDERLVADTITEILNESGFDAIAAYGGESAIESAAASAPDILLTDILMPKVDGVQLALTLVKAQPDLRVILFSGQAGISGILARAQDAGYIFDLLPKPLHPDKLIERLRER